MVNLVPPQETAEGEAFQLDREDLRQPPKAELLSGFPVLLALRTIPGLFTAQHFGLHKLFETTMQREAATTTTTILVPPLYIVVFIFAVVKLNAIIQSLLHFYDAVTHHTFVVSPVESEEDGRLVRLKIKQLGTCNTATKPKQFVNKQQGLGNKIYIYIHKDEDNVVVVLEMSLCLIWLSVRLGEGIEG